jgi:chaperonin GroES
MRKDTLAAGARSARFAGGVGENDLSRNIMSDKDRMKLEAATAKVEVARKSAPRQKFYPTEGILLVRRAEAAPESNVLITDPMEKEKPSEGIIIAFHPKSTYDSGECVVFGKYSGTEFKLNGEILLLLREEEVLGTLENV